MHDQGNDREKLSLSEFLKLTPLAHEIMQLSKETGMSSQEIMSFLEDMTKDPELDTADSGLDFSAGEADYSDADDDHAMNGYEVSLQVKGAKSFPALGFVAEVTKIDDLSYFFDTVLDMIEQLEDISE